MPIRQWRQFKEVAEWRLGMREPGDKDDVDWDERGL